MLNSIQQYVKGVINGITVPGQAQPLIAYVTPPTVDNMGFQPKAYVWAGKGHGHRQTAPRGPGFKQIDWDIDIYLDLATNANRPNVAGIAVDNQFPLIVDAVLRQLFTTTMPIFIDDNGTPQPTFPPFQGSTQVHHIGEDFHIDYPTERTPGTQRMLWYSLLLTISIAEVVQF